MDLARTTRLAPDLIKYIAKSKMTPGLSFQAHLSLIFTKSRNDEQIEKKRFANRSHGFEYAVHKLMESEGDA